MRRPEGGLGWIVRDRDLATRLALLIVGLAGMAAARIVSFVGQYPDREEPRIPALLWLFHHADALFLPGADHLPARTYLLWIQCAALALALVCFYLASRATIPSALWCVGPSLALISLPLAALLAILTLQGTLSYRLVIGSTHHYANDAVVATGCAAQAVLRGENPYRTFRMIPCLRASMDEAFAAIKTTPLQAGVFSQIRLYPGRGQLLSQLRLAEARGEAHPAEFESTYSYPAAAFLIPALALTLGPADLSIFFTVCYLAIAALVLRRAKGAARWVGLIALLANAALWPTLRSGASDSLYALLLLLAWAAIDRRWPSALALGLAVASRQPAWFYLPFYAILVGRTFGRRELAWRLGTAAGVFALCNLPFFLDAPSLWLEGVLGPMRDPMFPLGNGVVALSLGDSHALPLGSRGLYTVLEVAAFAASLAWYWRTCRKDPGTGLILAPLALFFAWRSLYSYFVPLTLLVLYPALVASTRKDEPVR